MRTTAMIVVVLLAASACDKKSGDDKGGGGAADYARGAKRSEADLQLDKIGKSLKAYAVQHGSFPVGKTGPTPAAPCCAEHRGTCPPTAWTGGPIWDDIEFAITETFRYQYEYEGTEKAFTVTAIGDLDCDTTTTTTTVTGEIGETGPTTSAITQSGSD